MEEEYKIVRVKWLDHFINEGRNATIEEVEKFGLATMQSVGFLIREDKDCIKLSSTIEPLDNDRNKLGFDYVLVISKKLIIEIVNVEG